MCINECENYPKSVIHHIIDQNEVNYDKQSLKSAYDNLVSQFESAKTLSGGVCGTKP